MVANNLKDIRIQNNITQEELARIVNCTLRTIQKIEKNNGYNPSIEICLKIKNVLKIKNIEDIFYIK